MALQNNIQTNDWAKKCARSRYFGKYNSFSDLIGYAAKEEKGDGDVPYLDFLMDDLDKLNEEITALMTYEDDNGNEQPRPYLVRSYKDGLFIVIVPNFEGLSKNLTPLVSENPPGLSPLVLAPTSLKAQVLAFGNAFGTSTQQPYFAGNANLFTFLNPNKKGDLELNGYVFSGGVQKAAARSILPIYRDTISLCFNPGLAQFNRFKFKFSPLNIEDSPASAVIDTQPTAADVNGFGGLTPVIYTENNIKTVYGTTTDPNHVPPIIQGTNYSDVLNIEKGSRFELGFHLFAHQSNNGSNPTLKDSLCMIFHQDGKPIGSTIDPFRDRLYELGYENVVGMDGSGSTFFYDYCKRKYMVDYGIARDLYMFTGYGISGV
jgi:hypothetical protein